MSWLAHHAQSEQYVSQAEELSRRHEGDQTAKLYRLAAEEEVKALNSLPYRKARTIGVTVVSAVSLYCKAQEFIKAKCLADEWLDKKILPAFAVKDLEDLLQMQYQQKTQEKH